MLIDKIEPAKSGNMGKWMRTTLWLFNIAIENGPFIDDHDD